MPIIDREHVWAALQCDLIETDGSPSTLEPVDAAYIDELIEAARLRLGRNAGGVYALDAAVDAELRQAITLDVAANYSQPGADLPAAYWSIVDGYRRWTFGVSESPQTIEWASVDPDDKVQRGINWTLALRGKAITASEWIVDAGEITLSAPSFTDVYTAVRVEGGVAGGVVYLTNRVTVTTGEQTDQKIRLAIR